MASKTAAPHGDSATLISTSSQGDSVLFIEQSYSELTGSAVIDPSSRWELVDTVQRQPQSQPQIRTPPSSSQLFAPDEPITQHTTPPSEEPTIFAPETELVSTRIWHPDPNVALSPPTVPVSLRQVWDYSIDELYGDSASGSTASTSAVKVEDDRLAPGRLPMSLELVQQTRLSAADPDVLDPLPLELPQDIFAATSQPPPSEALSSQSLDSNSREVDSSLYTSEPMQVASIITVLRGAMYRVASQLLPRDWRTAKFSAARIGAMVGPLGAVTFAVAGREGVGFSRFL
ncbi:hypothetical protein BDV98DRAFT_604873 [Pterulicium gracile]|uniref:Uncharacterized protein n=1 Tax=Pterulicium gracile TaxID=1884261 RepID=A0A5C3QKT5_9AGAR|nr:hypothetical protein BDV98DRAFT_604873 [Pterula gracilis]